MSTSQQRCVAGGQQFVIGLYPMVPAELSEQSLEIFLSEDSPLIGTQYEVLLRQIYDGNCQGGPVIDVPSYLENMMRSETCPIADGMLKYGDWKSIAHSKKVDQMLEDVFGKNYIKHTKRTLDKHFNAETKHITQSWHYDMLH